MKETPELLELFKRLLTYNQETGDLVWKWSLKGREEGTLATVNESGRNKVSFQYESYYAARIAYALMTGSWPHGLVVDHKNGKTCDDRWDNLVATTKGFNAFNSKLYKTNTSGLRGVGWIKRDRMWLARISFGGKARRLGSYHCIAHALQARREAEMELYGFNPQQ